MTMISTLSKAIKKSTIKVRSINPPLFSATRKSAFDLCTETLDEIERISKEAKKEVDAQFRMVKARVAFVKTLLRDIEPQLQRRPDLDLANEENLA